MFDQVLILGIVAATLHIAAYVAYVRQTLNGHSNPNPLTWGVWFVLTTLNAVVSVDISGHIVPSLQYIAGAIGSFLVFGYLATGGHFARLKARERLVLALCIVGVLVRVTLRDPQLTTGIVLLAILVSAQPTIRGVWREPHKERPLPWILWTFAFAATATNCFVRSGEIIEYLVPATSIGVDTTIAFLCSGWHARSRAPLPETARRVT